MSHRTVLNRWRRYQIARLEGLVDGLAREARRIPGQDHERKVQELGQAMFAALEAHCDSIARSVETGIRRGAPIHMPELAYERL